MLLNWEVFVLCIPICLVLFFVAFQKMRNIPDEIANGVKSLFYVSCFVHAAFHVHIPYAIANGVKSLRVLGINCSAAQSSSSFVTKPLKGQHLLLCTVCLCVHLYMRCSVVQYNFGAFFNLFTCLKKIMFRVLYTSNDLTEKKKLSIS